MIGDQNLTKKKESKRNLIIFFCFCIQFNGIRNFHYVIGFLHKNIFKWIDQLEIYIWMDHLNPKIQANCSKAAFLDRLFSVT